MIGHGVNWTDRISQLGYWIAETHQRRGLATEACRAFVDYALCDLGLNKVEIRTASDNTRSRRLAERLGFQLEGTIRQAEWLYDHHVDHAVYGLLRSEWQK